MNESSDTSREYYHYGRVYLESGEPENALAQFEIALDAEPGDPEILIGIGRAYIQLKDYEKAVESLEKALKKEPGFADIHYHLGTCFLNMNSKEKAINEFKEALNINPGYMVAKRRLNELMGAGGDAGRKREKERRKRNSEEERISRQANIHFHMGNALFEKGMLNEAHEEYRQAVKLRPNFPDIRNRLGELYMHRGKYTRAQEEFKAALKINPRYVASAVNLAEARRLLCEELLEKAEQDYRRVLEIDPGNQKAQEGLEKIRSVMNIDYI